MDLRRAARTCLGLAYDLSVHPFRALQTSGGDLFPPATCGTGQPLRGDIAWSDPCDTLREWSAQPGSGTLSLEHRELLPGKASPCAIRFTSSGSESRCGIRKTYPSKFDITDKILGISFYVSCGTKDGADFWRNVQRITLSVGNTSTGSRSSWTLYHAGNGNVHPGWNCTRVHASACAIRCGDFAPSECDVVEIEIDVLPGTTPIVTLNGFWLETNPLRKAVVIPMFDGWYSRQYEVAKYMHEVGMRGVFFGGEMVRLRRHRIPYRGLHELQDMGHIIGNYPYFARFWYQSNSRQKLQDFARNAQWLIRHGFGAGARLLSTPGYGWGELEESLLGRLVDWAFVGHSPTGRYQILPLCFRKSFHTISEGSDDCGGYPLINGQATIERTLDTAIAAKCCITLFGHITNDTALQTTMKQVEAVAAKAVSGELLVRTPLDLLAGDF